MVLEKTLESLDGKEIQPVHPKGDQSWVFIGRTYVEAETPILWYLMQRADSAGKDCWTWLSDWTELNWKRKKKILKAHQVQKKIWIIYAISHFYWENKNAKLYISTFKYKKENMFFHGFSWRRSLYRIFYWKKFSKNTPFVTSDRHYKLHTVLKIKWETQTSKHLITIWDLHAVIKKYKRWGEKRGIQKRRLWRKSWLCWALKQ